MVGGEEPGQAEKGEGREANSRGLVLEEKLSFSGGYSACGATQVVLGGAGVSEDLEQKDCREPGMS